MKRKLSNHRRRKVMQGGGRSERLASPLAGLLWALPYLLLAFSSEASERWTPWSEAAAKPQGTDSTNRSRPRPPQVSWPIIKEQHMPLLPQVEDTKISVVPRWSSKAPKVLEFQPTFSAVQLPSWSQSTENTLKSISPREYREIQAQIYLEKKQYELALGLYLELLDEAKKVKNSTLVANYLRSLVRLAEELNLYSDLRRWGLELGEWKEYKAEAYQLLGQKIRHYDEELAKKLMKWEGELSLKSPDRPPQFALLVARLLEQGGQLKEALATLERDELEHPELEAKIVLFKSVLYYRLGEVDKSIGYLLSRKARVTKQWPRLWQNEWRLLLGRLYFQKGQYQQARQEFSQVDQDYVEWLPAQVEGAWAQILAGDYEGAAGNMYSLHIDYFKNRFIPDSYMARAVSYLGLCQYGDALMVTQDFKNNYMPLVQKTSEINLNWGPEAYFDLMKEASQVSAQPPKELKGIPWAWVRYLSRDPVFVREQSVINDLEDEIQAYNRYTLRILNKEKALMQQKSELMVKAKTELSGDELEAVTVKLHIIKRSREAVRGLRAQGLVRIEPLKEAHKRLAGLALKSRMNQAHKRILAALDQVDVLQYEIYAGAGEHLRKWLAEQGIQPNEGKSGLGAKTQRDPTQVQWEYRGEIWKDEIGHLRSSLKNMCQE